MLYYNINFSGDTKSSTKILKAEDNQRTLR